MKKYGKYEKRPEGVPVKQPKVKSALLQTYLTSLLCMVLCVTMFFGTSYAWFTSEVENTSNEIYIGTLAVDLQDEDGESLANSDKKLFDSSIRWEPGYTSLETIRVVNKGNLAFNYELTFTDGKLTGTTDGNLMTVAKWFDVWVYHNANNEIPTPENYKQITEKNGWTPVGTLADVLGGKVVLKGKMDEADVVNETDAANKETAHTYTIALHMKGEQVEGDQDELNALMKQKMELNVKLVASQRSSEIDGFGDNRYDATFVATGEEFKAAMEDPDGGAVVLTDDITVEDRSNITGEVVLDLNGHTISDTGDALTMYVAPGGDLTITGDGKILKTNHVKNMIYYDGTLTVMNGTFAYADWTWGACQNCSHDNNPLKMGCMFVGRAGTKNGEDLFGKLTIYDGYFSSGLTNPDAFVTSAGTNVVMFMILNNVDGYPSDMVVYGGQFVDANPADGDCNAPYTLYLKGQTEKGSVPAEYEITPKTVGGHTVYTVTYTDPS